MLGIDSPFKLSIFAGYVALWVSNHLLVYASQRTGSPSYNITSVVLLTESAKFVMSVHFYVSNDGSVRQMVAASVDSWVLLVKYMVPAALYCIYNNLVYVNLQMFDPGTYNVLLQFKMVFTGVVYEIVFSKHLNRNQWAAIVLITVGCMCKESGKLTQGAILDTHLSGWILLLGQVLCSVFAGVYTEALLKGAKDKRVTTNLQNAFMYFQSMLANIIVLLVQGTLADAVSMSNAAAIFTPSVLCIIAMMASAGLVTGFFLKHLDSVVKAIAGSVEVVLTIFFTLILFGVPLTAMSVVAALIVGAGVALYSRPVSVPSAEAKAGVEMASERMYKNNFIIDQTA